MAGVLYYLRFRCIEGVLCTFGKMLFPPAFVFIPHMR